MPFESIFDSTLDWFASQEGETFVWSGNTYCGIINETSSDEGFELAGKRPQQSLTIVVSLSQFDGAYPSIRESIQARGITLSIRETRRDGGSLTLVCSTIT